MKTKTLSYFIYLFVIYGLLSCSEKEEVSSAKQQVILESPNGTELENQIYGEVIPEDKLIEVSHRLYEEKKQKKGSKLKYNWIAHKNMTYICARKLGLSKARATIMRDASIMPDVYQKGIQNRFNQQWSHAFMIKKTMFGASWIWGDADDDFHDNLDGDSGEIESPEGYNEKWAGYFYNLGKQDLGDWYVGYACHFMEDIGFVLHTSFPNVSMGLYHSKFEEWMDKNWNEGHCFINDALMILPNDFYEFKNPKEAIRLAAKSSNWYYSSYGKEAWLAYENSDYPNEIGTGNQELVNYTRQMIRETTKWTGATIKYALNKYQQW
jgi:hypothetical protein